MIPSGPKGTRDFYPETMFFQEHLYSSWQKTCRRYSFEAYEGPMFEHLDLYTQKSGTEIEKQLYSFEDKGRRALALRPEMTPSLARMVAAKGTTIKRPIRWYCISRLFRYEKMQKGRLREFIQLNMDILGSLEVSADAELIAAVIDVLRDLGLTNKDFQVHVSSRTLLEECFSIIGLHHDQCLSLYTLLDRKNKISTEEFSAELQTIIPDFTIRKNITALFGATTITDVAHLVGATPAQTVLTNLFALIENYNMSDYVHFDIGIVRGLAYYTGIVFEVLAVGKGMRAIAGGGRYDKLVELYGGIPTPAVGFAVGDVVLGDLLREKGLIPPMRPRCAVFIIAIDENGFTEVIPLAQQLRYAEISCEFSFTLIPIGKQLKQANGIGAPLALFIGGSESTEGTFRIKLMADGTELIVPRNDIIPRIRSMLPA